MGIAVPSYSWYGQSGVKVNMEGEGGDVWEIVDDEKELPDEAKSELSKLEKRNKITFKKILFAVLAIFSVVGYIIAVSRYKNVSYHNDMILYFIIIRFFAILNYVSMALMLISIYKQKSKTSLVVGLIICVLLIKGYLDQYFVTSVWFYRGLGLYYNTHTILSIGMVLSLFLSVGMSLILIITYKKRIKKRFTVGLIICGVLFANQLFGLILDTLNFVPNATGVERVQEFVPEGDQNWWLDE
jgi:membrane-associated HD superfamily phosphohydrolase